MISEAQAAEAPRIVIPTRPLEVPPELRALQPDAVVCYSQAKNPGAYLQSAFGTAAEAIQLVRDTIARQAAGWFYIFEAAQILADANGLSAREVLRDMHRAVECGRLRFRRFSTGLPVGPGDQRGEYMTPGDLNSWLEGEGAGYRFPVQQTEATPASASAPAVAIPKPVEAPAAPEAKEARQARRHQMCIDANLPMPTSTYSHLPRGIGRLAKAEGITRQAFSEDVKAHIGRLYGR